MLSQNRPSYMAHTCMSLSFRLLTAAHGSQTTPVVYRVPSGETRIIHVYLSEQDTSQEALQYYNSYTNIQLYYIRLSGLSLTNDKFTNHLFIYYKP